MFILGKGERCVCVCVFRGGGGAEKVTGSGVERKIEKARDLKVYGEVCFVLVNPKDRLRDSEGL